MSKLSALIILKLITGIPLLVRNVAAYSFDTSVYKPEDVIYRDVAIIGGGSSGVYAAIRLPDFDHSVVVIERNDYLGGHAQTYTDPMNGRTIDYGVSVFTNISVVTEYFARFGVPLVPLPAGPNAASFVDFKTGKPVQPASPTPNELGAAFEGYAVQLAKYPGISLAFNLTYPVPPDLLLPFGDFLTKYDLQALAYSAYIGLQGFSPILKIPTLYVMKYLNPIDFEAITTGFLTTERHDVAELYQKAGQQLGSDVLLSSRVLAMDRSSSPMKVLVQTSHGVKLIVAKRLVAAIPPLLSNMGGFDLSKTEESLFGEFFNNAYYSGILNNTGLKNGQLLDSVDPSQPLGDVPAGGLYEFEVDVGTNLTQIFYAVERPQKIEQVQANVEAALQRTQKGLGLPITKPVWLAFGDHAPFNVMVSNQSIQNRFYESLFDLQGERNTFYTGAAWTTHSSSTIWTFSEVYLLPKILGSF